MTANASVRRVGDGRIARARAWLPTGDTLPQENWERRHRGVVVLLWAHVVGLGLFGLYVGLPAWHVAIESGIILAFALAASFPRVPRRVRATIASLGLMSCSGILVHFSGGYIEAHFHFFVMLGVISLYEDWTPFLLAIAYVALHHGIVGTLDPRSVFNHAAAFANPWEWAAIHATFILSLSVANVVTWRLSETARARTRQVLDSAAEGILGVDASGRIVFANPAAAQITRRTPNALDGALVADVLRAPSGPIAIGTVPHARPSEGVLVTADGARVPVEFVTNPLLSGAQEVGLVVAFRDVSARARAEEELRRSREDLRDFVETSAIGLHWVGPDGTILWANEADHVVLGYSAEEYVGRKIQEFHADPPVIADILARLTRGERLHEYPARLRAKDGSIRHVLIDSSVLWDKGEFIHTRCFTRDVTASRKAEEDLASTRVALAQAEKLAALGTLVSGLFHEVRTPLTYIQTHAFVLRGAAKRASAGEAGALPPDVVLRAAEDIVRGTERINALVADLRRFTRMEPAVKSASALDSVVHEAVELFRVTHRDVTVRFDARATAETYLDRSQVQQVVLNLLQNAADASGAPCEIEIACMPAGPNVARVSVTDHGPGIPQEVAHRMFEPLFTTKENGTGLGLAIVKRICDDHAATISWATTPGGGTTFTIDFPTVAAAAPRRAPAPAPRTPPS